MPRLLPLMTAICGKQLRKPRALPACARIGF